jgi:hypothetical protein
VVVSGSADSTIFHIWRLLPTRQACPSSAYCTDLHPLNLDYSKYPWSMYAVFQTTLTQWAFLLDCLLCALVYFALRESGYYAAEGQKQPHAEQWQRSFLWGVFIAHWVFAKTIKLVPHLLRNPGDVRFIPASVAFGYFHNLIKLYGCITVTEVISQPRIHCRFMQLTYQTTWGTREGADTDDNIRMLPILPTAIITPPLTPPPGGRMLRERCALFPTALS